MELDFKADTEIQWQIIRLLSVIFVFLLFLTCPSILTSGGAGSAAGHQEAAKSLQIIRKVTFGDNTKLIYIVCNV